MNNSMNRLIYTLIILMFGLGSSLTVFSDENEPAETETAAKTTDSKVGVNEDSSCASISDQDVKDSSGTGGTAKKKAAEPTSNTVR